MTTTVANPLDRIVRTLSLRPRERANTAPVFWRWGDLFWLVTAFVSIMLLQAHGFLSENGTRYVISIIVEVVFLLMSLVYCGWSVLIYLNASRQFRSVRGNPLRIYYIVQNGAWVIAMILALIGVSLTSQSVAPIISIIIAGTVLLWTIGKLIFHITNRDLLKTYDYLTNGLIFFGTAFIFVILIITTSLMMAQDNISNIYNIGDPYGALNVIALILMIILFMVFFAAILPDQLRISDHRNRFQNLSIFIGNFIGGSALETAGMCIAIAVAAVLESTGGQSNPLELSANAIAAVSFLLVPYDIIDKAIDIRKSSSIYEKIFTVSLIIMTLLIVILSLFNFGFAIADAKKPDGWTAIVALSIAFLSTLFEAINGIIEVNERRQEENARAQSSRPSRDTRIQSPIWADVLDIIGNFILLVAIVLAILGTTVKVTDALVSANVELTSVALGIFVLVFLLKIIGEIAKFVANWREGNRRGAVREERARRRAENDAIDEDEMGEAIANLFAEDDDATNPPANPPANPPQGTPTTP